MSDFKVVKLLDPITINLGGPNFTGEYVPATTYSIGESVSYLGSSYVALATTTGNLPTDVTHWQLLAQKGDAGNAATSYDVRNQTGVAIAKFRAVYFSGSTGLRPLITLSNANTEIASSKTAGVTSVIINNNADGTIVHDGVMSNLDTSSFAVGDFLWLSTTPGVVTNVRPTQPNHAVFIGYVTRSHPTLGTALIDIQNGYELEELHDVLITSVTNGQVLSYETSSLMWKNITLTKSSVGLSLVDNTSDVNKPVSTAQGLADAAIQAYSIQRANHTGTQTASTISDFDSAADARVAIGITNHEAALDPHPQYTTNIESIVNALIFG